MQFMSCSQQSAGYSAKRRSQACADLYSSAVRCVAGWGTITKTTAVADPGFPPGGGTNYPEGAPTYDFAKFSQKLHEIERIWTRGGRVQNFTM